MNGEMKPPPTSAAGENTCRRLKRICPPAPEDPFPGPPDPWAPPTVGCEIINNILNKSIYIYNRLFYSYYISDYNITRLLGTAHSGLINHQIIF